MAKFWTWAEIKSKVKADLDIEGETFVRAAELLGYANEAIDEAEAEIHALYEDYFLTSAQIAITSGTEEYDLPSDIYAHKIRRIIYNNGSSVYTVNRVRDWHKFETKAISDNFASSDLYQFFIKNATAGSPKIVLVPKARDTGSFLTVWYIRNANRLAIDADLCDIPEFINYIFKKISSLVYTKEGHPNMVKSDMDLVQEKQRMLGVLAQMVPDAENEIEIDTSFYEEMN